MTKQNADFDMDAILDGTLDDLADSPEFKNYPVGTHRAIISFEQKKVNEKPAMQINLKGIATEELPAGSEDEPISEGQEASVLYQMTSEWGQGDFKKVLKQLAVTYGTDLTNRQIMEAAQGAEVLVVTNLRPNKDKTKMYMGIDSIAVV